MKNQNLKKFLLAFLAVTTLSVGVACNKPDNKPDNSSSIDFVVSGIDESVMVGRELELPAVANVDGYKVKINVVGYNSENVIVDEPFTGKDASAVNSFTAKTSCTRYEITYYIRLDNGEKVKKSFTVSVVGDEEKPYLVVPETFNLEEGITTDELAGYSFSGFLGYDNPGMQNITEKISVTVYSGDTVVDYFTYDEGVHKIYQGTYRVVLGLKDLSGNEATAVEFPLVVNKANVYGKNLLPDFIGNCTGSTEKNFAPGAYGGYSMVQISDEIVTMKATATNTFGNFRINIAGERGSNVEWPVGLLVTMYDEEMKLTCGGTEFVQYALNPFKDATEAVEFKYQVTVITIDGEEYIRVRLWKNGEEITGNIIHPDAVSMSAYGAYEGVAVKMSAFGTTNMKKTDLCIANWDGGQTNVVVEALYLAENTEEALVITTSEAEDNNVVGEITGSCTGTENKTFAPGQNGFYATKEISDEIVTIKATATSTNGNFRINIAGAAGDNHDWPVGLLITMYDNEMKLTCGGTEFVQYALNPFKDATEAVEFKYQVTVITIDGEEYIRVRLWKNGEALTGNAIHSDAVLMSAYGAYEGVAIKANAFGGVDMSKGNLCIANWDGGQTNVVVEALYLTENTEEALVITTNS